jgi:hypothetical protein
MPTSDYSFLSDTQREYLENPDAFDSQRSAELAYRIRQKYQAVSEDLELLHESPEAWDKMEDGKPVRLECAFQYTDSGPHEFGECDNTLKIPAIRKYGKLSGDIIECELDNGWIRANPTMMGSVDRTEWSAVCPSCHEQAVEHAREHGSVPCPHSDCTTHRAGSNIFNEHREALALTEEDLQEIDAINMPAEKDGKQASL